MVDYYLGIHLGNNECIACVYVDGKPNIIPRSDTTNNCVYSFPSYVAFTSGGNVIVGEVAKRRYVRHPKDVVRCIRNEIGRNIKREYFGKSYSSQEILAFVLGKIKKDAEIFLNNPINNAVITVPAYFDDNQRKNIKYAGMLASLNVELINEPTAACLAHGITECPQNILVFDLGNDTLDVTILKYDSGIFEVKSTSGDTQFGEIDIVHILSDFFIREFEKRHCIKLNADRKIRNRLIETAERVIVDLSSVYETHVNLPFMAMDSNGNPLDLDIVITRAQFDGLIRPIVQRCAGPIQTAIDSASLTKNDVDNLILVGNQTRIPIVRKFVENLIGIAAEDGVDPVTCIAQGAALKGVVENDEIESIKNKKI